MSEKRESCEEALMQALEEVSTASSVLILIRHHDDECDRMSWHGYPNSNIERLGMIEFARNAIRRRLRKGGSD